MACCSRGSYSLSLISHNDGERCPCKIVELCPWWKRHSRAYSTAVCVGLCWLFIVLCLYACRSLCVVIWWCLSVYIPFYPVARLHVIAIHCQHGTQFHFVLEKQDTEPDAETVQQTDYNARRPTRHMWNTWNTSTSQRSDRRTRPQGKSIMTC